MYDLLSHMNRLRQSSAGPSILIDLPKSESSFATMSLPSLQLLQQDQTELHRFLILLLEPSEILSRKLVPNVHSKLQASALSSYCQILDACQVEVTTWLPEDRQNLIGGHPLIGEVQGLSALSSKEQGNLKPTPEPVLRR